LIDVFISRPAFHAGVLADVPLGRVSGILIILNFSLQGVSVLEVHQFQPSASLLGHLAVLHFSLVCLCGVVSLYNHSRKFCF
jgi:hypothetical protein